MTSTPTFHANVQTLQAHLSPTSVRAPTLEVGREANVLSFIGACPKAFELLRHLEVLRRRTRFASFSSLASAPSSLVRPLASIVLVRLIALLVCFILSLLSDRHLGSR